jgi:uncharacterized membrane protein YphA (DoxX/SURF4 family)
MAFDRRATGFVVIRLCLGVLFIAEGLGKLRWFLDSSALRSQLGVWLETAAPGSIGQVYLQRVALPGVAVFARLVPLGELVCGAALLAGFSTTLFAFVAFFMLLNYQIASGAILKWSFLANRAAFPVLGSTLGLALGGIRLPWSIRS